MLKSMKQKFSGKRSTASTATKEEPASGNTNSRPIAASTATSTASRPAQTPSRPAAAVKEKAPLPSLTEANAIKAFSETLPSFRDVPASEKQNLFVRKLHLCAFTFDFSDPAKFTREKEIKRQTLLELVDYVNTGNGKFSEAVAEDVVYMLTNNLFRDLPATRSNELDNLDPDEEEPALEPTWPHLQIAYEFLLRYVVSNDTDAKTAKRHIDHKFIVQLLELFDSEDPRERDYLKTILHRIYGKFMVHRPYIRKAINHVFYRFVFETERHNGVAELLEILGSIINGFALPLKEEHKGSLELLLVLRNPGSVMYSTTSAQETYFAEDSLHMQLFLTRALMPLHKPKCVGMYHQPLAYCVTQFVEKDPKLGEPVLRALLRFWPLTNSQKEVLFLGELEEILEMTLPQEFSKICAPLFKQIARCLNSSHFQVAERSLLLWNNEYILSLVAQHRSQVLPHVFSALEANARSHWNPAVHGLTCNVRKMFQEMDEELYEECRQQYEKDEERGAATAQQRREQWDAIEAAAAKQRQQQRLTSMYRL